MSSKTKLHYSGCNHIPGVQPKCPECTIERLTATSNANAEHARLANHNRDLCAAALKASQARVEELEGVLMTESEKRDLLSKEHYRNKIAKLQARVEALEGVREAALTMRNDYEAYEYQRDSGDYNNPIHDPEILAAFDKAIAATEQENKK